MLAGCARATAPQPEVVPPLPTWGAREHEMVAELIRAEDRRDWASPVLTAAAEHHDPRIRSRAALALGRLREERVRPLLLRLLADPDSGTVATAVWSVGQLGDSTALPLLARLLRTGGAARQPTVMREAAEAIGKLRPGAARDSLFAFLASAPPADTVLSPALAAALVATTRHPRRAELAPVLRWADATDPGLRWSTAYALGRRPAPGAASTLLRLARDADPRVRAVALRALRAPVLDSAGIAPDSSVSLLVSATADADYDARIAAVFSLGSHRSTAAVGRLGELSRSLDPHLALAATEALTRLGPAARTALSDLQQAFADPARHIALRAAALTALARIDTAMARPLLAAAAAEPAWRLRAAAARLVGSSGALDSELLLRLLRDSDPRIPTTLLRAVSERDTVTPAARAILLPALAATDPYVRAAATGALARTVAPGDLPLFLDAYARAARDSTTDAAGAALDALAALRGVGIAAAPAFFSRFPAHSDPQVRSQVARLWGDTALAWGPPTPFTVTRSADEYRGLGAASEARAPAPRRARISTERGVLEVLLLANDAPLTVDNFVRLARRGFFDGQEWPRVVPGFVVQGGDPRGDTESGPGYAIRDELNRHRYRAGTLGMALSGPDTGGSQFFITHSPQPHLDGGYTVFGQLLSGMEVARSLLPGDRITRIEVY